MWYVASKTTDGLNDVVIERLSLGIEFHSLECHASKVFLAKLSAVCIHSLNNAFCKEEQ